MYVRKVGVKQGLRLPLQTMIGQTYTVWYRFERERVIGDPTKAPAPSAIVRVTNDELGKGLLQEKIHHGSFSTTYQETAELTFRATHSTSFLFLLTETPSLETGLSWVTFQEVETDAVVLKQKGNLVVDLHYRRPNEGLSGTYEGEISAARLFVNGTQQSVGGTFKNGEFTYFVPAGSLRPQDQVMLVGLNTQKDVQAIAPVSVIQIGDCQVNPFRIGEDHSLTGTYQQEAPIKAQLTLDGVKKAIGGTFDKGTFTYYVGANVIQLGSTAVLAFYDANGHLIEEHPIHCYGARVLKAHYGFGRSTIEGIYEGQVARFKLVKEAVDGTQTVLGWGGTLFPEETPKRFSFWVQASALKETDQLWVTPFNDQDQALDTGSSVTIESGTLQLDPHYLGEAYLRGRYTGPMTGAYLYGGGSSSPLRKGGDFYADGRFQFYVSGLDLSQLPVTLVPYNAVGDVVTVDQEVPIRKGKLSSHAYLLGASQVTALIRETFRWPNFKSIKTRLKPHGEGPLRIKRIPFMCTQAGLPRPRML